MPGNIDKKTEQHGESLRNQVTPEYKAWKDIIQRCTNPKNKRWDCYGGRGIKICHEWRQSYKSFLAHVGRRPSPKHSIDRIDNNGHYEPGNVRWTTHTQQLRNMRRNRFITYLGRTLCLQEWANEMGMAHQTLSQRLKNHGTIAPIRAPQGRARKGQERANQLL